MICSIALLVFSRWLGVGGVVDAFSSSLQSASHGGHIPTGLISQNHQQNQWQPQHKWTGTRLNSVVDDGSGENGEVGPHINTDVGDPPPLFVESDGPSIQSTLKSGAISPSLMQSIERAKRVYLYNTPNDKSEEIVSNDEMLKQIVQAGIQFQQNQMQQRDRIYSTKQVISFPTMEKVPGCIATVHVQTSLIPISHDESAARDPSNYCLSIEGTADAMLSGGLLAILADAFGGGNANHSPVTAENVLKLDPDSLTSAMGLQSVLSRGRNDGMASMVRVIQHQIKSMLVEVDGTKDEGGTKLDELLQSSSSLLSSSANETTDKPTVAMLLSGGVDSSVALNLLLRQNYNVTAFYLRIWLEDELAHLGECPWEDDLQVCQAVCEHAGNVPLETVSLGKEYRERVVQYTIEEAQRGRTPNPDIMCNSRVKFGCFLEYIEQSGMEFDYVASGHYARLEDEVPTDPTQQPRKRLFRAPDPVKDQSYFLCALTQKQLSKVLFPIGNYQKSEVRELANHFALPNRNRPDSQGLCFLGKVRFDDFLASYLGNRPGDVVDALNGEVIGRHNGLWYHTVGQRKGIGKVMFPLATARGPWYVVAKDQKRDIVYVSNRYEEEDFARARSEFEVEDVRWISGEPPAEVRANGGADHSWNELRVDMKIRHGPRIVQGTLLLKDDGSTGKITLDNKDGGLAPGQYVVFYQLGTDECLGAGVISEKHWAKFLQNYEDLIAGNAEEVVSTQ